MAWLLYILVGFAALYVGFLLAEVTPLARLLRPAAWARLRGCAAFGASVPFLILAASAVGWNPLPQPLAEALPALEIQAASLRPAPVAAPSFPKYDKANEPDIHWLVHQYSDLYGVDPLLVLSVIQEESQFDARAVSHRGAMGLMQITRETAKHLGLNDPFSVPENIEGGVRYLRFLLERYHWDLRLALASYNAGPTTVDRFGGIPPYPETHRYVRKVTSRYKSLKRMAEAFSHWRPEKTERSLIALAPGKEKTEAEGGAATLTVVASQEEGS